jgi:hypothetical protein
MFHSIETSWKGVMAGNQDFKELTPEFFYMPEFLYNHSGFDLGTTQKGETLGDVIMPKWAKNADDFVKLNRLALESDIVSRQLHSWFDLVFGYKQRGPAAEIAHNVFYHLTYEGSVDISTIEDPEMRKATEAQIVEYGQTPVQLFSKQHVQRDEKTSRDVKPFSGAMRELFASFSAESRGHPVVFVHPHAETIVTLSAGRRLASHSWTP